MANNLFIGVEGGSSCSKGILVNGEGTVLSSAETGGTNHWQIGIPKTTQIILQLVDELLTHAGMAGSSVSTIGLSLSGAETPSCVTAIASALYNLRPSLILQGKKAEVYNDAIAALETATDKGGIVLISGTGTNCRFIDITNKTSYNCGGWGHMIGDEGGAYWITLKALKSLIDHDDNMEECQFNLDFVRQSMNDYFKIENNSDMLRHLYTDFKKSYMAGFTVRLAEGASQGDQLCLSVFAEAGVMLAKHVIAVCRKSGLKQESITIVCVGSVWKSWTYMSDSFQSTVSPLFNQFSKIILVKLKGNGAIGAAVSAARDSGYNVPIDYSKHAERMCIISQP